jgi:hypothetical protein
MKRLIKSLIPVKLRNEKVKAFLWVLSSFLRIEGMNKAFTAKKYNSEKYKCGLNKFGLNAANKSVNPKIRTELSKKNKTGFLNNAFIF